MLNVGKDRERPDAEIFHVGYVTDRPCLVGPQVDHGHPGDLEIALAPNTDLHALCAGARGADAVGTPATDLPLYPGGHIFDLNEQSRASRAWAMRRVRSCQDVQQRIQVGRQFPQRARSPSR